MFIAFVIGFLIIVCCAVRVTSVITMIPALIITYRIASIIFIANTFVFHLASFVSRLIAFVILCFLILSIAIIESIVPTIIIAIMGHLRNGILIIWRIRTIEIIISGTNTDTEVQANKKKNNH